jgi:hypothetical protein
VPELVAFDESFSVANAANLASALIRHAPGLSVEGAKTGSRIIVEATGALMDYVGEHPETKRAISEGLADMFLGYLERLGVAGA